MPDDIGHVQVRVVRISASVSSHREQVPEPVAIQVLMTPTLKEQTDERVLLGLTVRGKVDAFVEVAGTFEVNASYIPITCSEGAVASPRSLELLSRIASGPIENVLRHAVSLALSEYRIARDNRG
jgi:hypothetical protein